MWPQREPDEVLKSKGGDSRSALGAHGDPSLSFNLQSVQNLFVQGVLLVPVAIDLNRWDCARKLEKAIRERACVRERSTSYFLPGAPTSPESPNFSRGRCGP